MSFETARLRLCNWDSSMLDTLYELAKDPEIARMCGFPIYRGIEDAEFALSKIFIADSDFAVFEKATHQLVGAFSLKDRRNSHFAKAPHERELGLWIGTPYWGQGFAKELIAGALQHLFTVVNIDCIYYCYFDFNEASAGLAQHFHFLPFTEEIIDNERLIACRLSAIDYKAD